MAAADLWRAAEEGNNAKIVNALSGDFGRVNVDAKDSDGNTALHLAAKHGHTATVDLLLNRGADIHAKKKNGWTALHAAAHNGHTATVDLLLGRGADIHAKKKNGLTALHFAAHNGHTATVDLLLHRGADIHAKDNDGCTALHAAAALGHTATVDLLLDRGADIHAKKNNGFTALHYAAHNGHTATVDLLLHRGADIHAKDNDGWTALHAAAALGCTATVDLLWNRGADIHAKNNKGFTALHYAAALGHTATVDLLLNRGADIHAKNHDGWTALHSAAALGHTATVDLLWNRGADIHAKNNNGLTGLLSVAQDDHTATVDLLFNHAADIHAKNYDGWTALHWAAEQGHTATVDLLLSCGADIHARSMNGKTPVDIVKDPETRRVLLSPRTVVPTSTVGTSVQPLWNERYQIQTLIGKGAQGKVYKALDAVDGSVWAIKRLPTSEFVSGPVADRVRRQADAEWIHLRDIEDTHIIRYREAFIYDNDLCVVLEHVEGGSVASHIDGNSGGGVGLSPAAVMWTAVDILSGLVTLHEHAIIHRDISPGNILYRKDGTALLSDFASSIIHTTSLDRTVSVFGTQKYLSPEGLAQRDATTATDVWSLGAVLLYMLTGVKVCEESTVRQLLIKWAANEFIDSEAWTLDKHMNNELTVLQRDTTNRLFAKPIGAIVTPAQQAAWRDAPESLREVISRCLRANPAERDTASTLLDMPCFRPMPLRTTYGSRPLPLIIEPATAGKSPVVGK